jgi:hypothetical protein
MTGSTKTTATTEAADALRQLTLCSEALRAARTMRALTTGLSVVAAAGMAVAGLLAGVPAMAFWTVTLGLGALAQWLAFRIAFDAALFGRLADDGRRGQLDLAGFDRAMQSLGMLPAAKVGRDVAARCRGALTLLRALGVVVVMQIVLIIIAAVQLHYG